MTGRLQILRLHVLYDSVRALLAETNVKLSRVGGLHAVDTSTSHDKRAGIGGMQLDTQLEELRNLQVTNHISCSGSTVIIQCLIP